MDNLTTVTFRHVPHSPDLTEQVEQEARKLRRRHDCVQRCKVVIERPHRRRRSGDLYRANVLVSLPGKKLFSPRQIKSQRSHEDPAAAVSAAFNALEQAVNTYVHRWDRPRAAMRLAPIT